VMVAFVVANGVLIFTLKSGAQRPYQPSYPEPPAATSVLQFARVKVATPPRNLAAPAIALGTLGLVLLAIYWPWVAQHLRFEPLSVSALGVALVCGFFGWAINWIWRNQR
jgi:hypothetical protein